MYRIMEEKKSIRASLENKRLLFAEMGLVAALAAVSGAFAWTSGPAPVALLSDTTTLCDEADIMSIPLETPPPPPEAPAIPEISDQLEIVDDSETVDLEFLNLTEETGAAVALVDYKPEVPEEEEVPEEIPFVLADRKPSFQGGDANDFSRWVNAHLDYPAAAVENNISGRVILQFTVGTDGSVSAVKVLRSVDPLLDREAVRVVSSSPKWTPGKQRDRTVRVTYTFPVIFQLR